MRRLLEDEWDFHGRRMVVLPRSTPRVTMQPMGSFLGEHTLDEMFLVIPQLLVRHP